MKIDWKYAIGELLIVTVGILIAFGLNNWAQGQQEKKKAHTYLESLAADLSADLEVLNDNLAFVQQNQQTARSIIGHFHRTLPGRDSVPFKIFSELLGMPTFIPHDATYQTLKNSGDFRLVEDMELKNQIVDHYSRYNEIFMEDDRTKAFLRDHVSLFFMNETSFETMQQQADDLLEDYRLRNIVYAWFGIYKIQTQILERNIQRTEALINAVQQH
jgi:hypothetical protein